MVTASSLQLSALSRGASTEKEEKEGKEEEEGRKRKRQRRRRRKLASLFASPSLPPWMGRVEREGSGCSAYLVSTNYVLVPAPCLLQGKTSLDSLSFVLGPHSRKINSLLLHPSREGHDLALLQLSSPLPSSRHPACLSPITSKYSTLLSEEGASHAVSTSWFYLHFFDFDTHYLIIACLVAVRGAELVRVVAFPARQEEGEEEEVALAERGQVDAMQRAEGEKGEGGGR